jgi:vacuolar-type H+-ATPase subunit I/STV1
MKSTFSTSASITLQQSLDLYLEGRKGKILEKTFSISNLKAIPEECVTNASNNKELEEVKEFCQKFGHKLDNDLEFLYSCLKIIITNLGEVNHIFDNEDVQKLLNKYKITQPVDLIKAFNNLTTSLYKNNHLEEIYYLIYVISYCLVSSIIKALIKIKNEFDKLALDKIIENNIIKEELISKFMKEVNIPGENILNQDIWKQIQRCKNFIKDKEMNEMDKKIINYVETKSIDDYKKDLISLLQPHVENINLDGLDPQNISQK